VRPEPRSAIVAAAGLQAGFVERIDLRASVSLERDVRALAGTLVIRDPEDLLARDAKAKRRPAALRLIRRSLHLHRHAQRSERRFVEGPRLGDI